jgi:hypothetical protein
MNAKLRCREGDLALVLRSTDAGRLVTCLALADERERVAFDIDPDNGPVWRIDRCCMWNNWSEGEIPLPYCPDSALLPIRPRPDRLDEESMPDLSDIDHFHQLVASGQLADILTRIASLSDKERP